MCNKKIKLILKDEFACWEFQGFDENQSVNDLNELSEVEINKKYSKNLINLEIAITELYVTELLKPNLVCFTDFQIKIDQSKSMKEVIVLIIDGVRKSNKNELVFWIEGETKIENSKSKQIGIIKLLYELWSDLISISTYSELWMPISNKSDYWSKPDEFHINIATATLNSNRFQNTLERIKQKGNFKNIYPDEDEICNDYGIVRKGFRMYYSEYSKAQIMQNHKTQEMNLYFISEDK